MVADNKSTTSAREDSVRIEIPASMLGDIMDFGWYRYLDTPEAIRVLLTHALLSQGEIDTSLGDRRQSADEVVVDSLC